MKLTVWVLITDKETSHKFRRNSFQASLMLGTSEDDMLREIDKQQVSENFRYRVEMYPIQPADVERRKIEIIIAERKAEAIYKRRFRKR